MKPWLLSTSHLFPYNFQVLGHHLPPPGHAPWRWMSWPWRSGATGGGRASAMVVLRRHRPWWFLKLGLQIGWFIINGWYSWTSSHGFVQFAMAYQASKFSSPLLIGKQLRFSGGFTRALDRPICESSDEVNLGWGQPPIEQGPLTIHGVSWNAVEVFLDVQYAFQELLQLMDNQQWSSTKLAVTKKQVFLYTLMKHQESSVHQHRNIREEKPGCARLHSTNAEEFRVSMPAAQENLRWEGLQFAEVASGH